MTKKKIQMSVASATRPGWHEAIISGVTEQPTVGR